MRHRGDVQGLRAIAVALVLLYHAQVGLFGGGFVGVDVFFVVSGFLITQSLAAEAEGNGRIALVRFYARRARRLLPAAAVVLAVTAVATRLLLPVTAWRPFGLDIGAAAGYVVNWRFAARSVDYLAEDIAPSPVLHFWSLAVEEQFYILWPVLILALAALAMRRGWPLRATLGLGLMAAVVVPSLAWSVAATSADPARAFFDTGTRLWELGVGGVAALVAHRVPTFGRRVALTAKAVALATIVACAVLIDAGTTWPGLTALWVTIPTAALLLLGGTHDDAVERLLSLRPLQHTGALSYSLYLWHWPPLAILAARWGSLTSAQAVAIVAASVVPAVLCYRYVENPVRYGRAFRDSDRLSLSFGANLSLVGLLAGFAVVLAASLSPANVTPAVAGSTQTPRVGQPDLSPVDTPDGGPSSPDADFGTDGGPSPLAAELSDADLAALLVDPGPIFPAPLQAPEDAPQSHKDGCQVPSARAEPEVCVYGAEDGEVHVALVGDSKATQWSPAVVSIAERNGWRFTHLTKSSCVFGLQLQMISGEPFTECLDWSREILEILLADPPDVVLTSQAGNLAWTDGDALSARELLVDGMVDAYRRLEAAGSQVVLVVDNPPPERNVYECVAEHLDDLRPCVFPRDEDGGGRGVQLAAAERGEFATIDLVDRICPASTCLPVIDGLLVYRQGTHITATYARALTDVVEQRLFSVAPILADTSRPAPDLSGR